MLKPSRVVRLLLPVVRKQSRKCATCENFNLNEGQEAMKSNPYFTAAAQVVPPSRMGRTLYTPPTEGESFEDVQSRHGQAQAQFEKNAPNWKWEDFGACRFESKLVWKGDTCKAWKSALGREVKAALLGEDDDGVHGV
jgi:hypothetical protein